MKLWRCSLILALSLLPVTSQARPELQNDDGAYALLIVAFRQMQSHLIERDYQNRLDITQAVEDPARRRAVADLAAQERATRLQRLHSQLAVFGALYEDARHRDEEETGQQVPAQIDEAAAHRQFQDFVIIASFTLRPLSPATNSNQHSTYRRTSPAGR